MNIEKYDPNVESQQQAAPQAAVVVEEKPRRHSNRGWWVALIVLAAVILLSVTCPDKKQHTDAIGQQVSNAVTNTLVGKVGNWAVMGNMLVSKVVDLALESNVQMHNFVVCSYTTAEYDGQKRVMSVGALNNVWVLFDSKQLQKVIEQQGTQIWESLAGDLSGFISGLTGISVADEEPDAQSADQGLRDGTLQDNLDDDAAADTTMPAPKQTQTAQDLIDQAIDDVSTEVGKAVQKGIGKAIDDIVKGLTNVE